MTKDKEIKLYKFLTSLSLIIFIITLIVAYIYINSLKMYSPISGIKLKMILASILPIIPLIMFIITYNLYIKRKGESKNGHKRN